MGGKPPTMIKSMYPQREKTDRGREVTGMEFENTERLPHDNVSMDDNPLSRALSLTRLGQVDHRNAYIFSSFHLHTSGTSGPVFLVACEGAGMCVGKVCPLPP